MRRLVTLRCLESQVHRIVASPLFHEAMTRANLACAAYKQVCLAAPPRWSKYGMYMYKHASAAQV